uniref:Uncharacterized protein n=1 Tax=Ditylenchus dipsaci TaxID=166011 RepID=A0A915CLT3_9BILA
MPISLKDLAGNSIPAYLKISIACLHYYKLENVDLLQGFQLVTSVFELLSLQITTTEKNEQDTCGAFISTQAFKYLFKNCVKTTFQTNIRCNTLPPLKLPHDIPLFCFEDILRIELTDHSKEVNTICSASELVNWVCSTNRRVAIDHSLVNGQVQEVMDLFIKLFFESKDVSIAHLHLLFCYNAIFVIMNLKSLLF